MDLVMHHSECCQRSSQGSWQASQWLNFGAPWKKQNWSVILTFFSTKDLDFSHVKHTWAHVISFSKPWRIHLQPNTGFVVTIGSSIKALMEDCQTPDLVRGHLHFSLGSHLSAQRCTSTTFFRWYSCHDTEKYFPFNTEQWECHKLLYLPWVFLLGNHTSSANSTLLVYLSPPPDNYQDLPQLVQEHGTPIVPSVGHSAKSWGWNGSGSLDDLLTTSWISPHLGLLLKLNFLCPTVLHIGGPVAILLHCAEPFSCMADDDGWHRILSPVSIPLLSCFQDIVQIIIKLEPVLLFAC